LTDVIFHANHSFTLTGWLVGGFSISDMNIVIEIAPEDKKPIYTALQTILSSIGLFFPVLGGTLLQFVGSYTLIYLLSIALLCIGLWVSLGLRR